MIDRLARNRFRTLLSDLASGSITNDLFEDNLPCSADPAILGLFGVAWHFYGDLREHTLTERWALDSASRELFARMQLFLDSEFEYVWRHPLALELLYLPLSMISLGLIPRFFELLRLGPDGRRTWPFHPSQWGAA